MEARADELRVCFHADTDQEYTDHATRLAFIGPTDTLDYHFFAPADVSPAPAHHSPALAHHPTATIPHQHSSTQHQHAAQALL